MSDLGEVFGWIIRVVGILVTVALIADALMDAFIMDLGIKVAWAVLAAAVLGFLLGTWVG